MGDIDTKADPCTDFFQFANGKWRAENPIPPSMVRWSRRWKAGEDAKEQLKGILDDVSRKTDWPRGSVEELIGDYYGSCMNEAAVNKLGITPAKPMLAKIDAMKTPADLQSMIRQLNDIFVLVPFVLTSSPDNHNPTQTIASISAGGLGLPDRDYYLKTEPRFQEPAKNICSTLRPCSSSPAMMMRKRKPPRKLSSRWKRNWLRHRWITSRCVIHKPPTTKLLMPISRSLRRS